jgi:lysophospholipase L1-like esterase
LENELNANARVVRVIEDCLNGRRTVWDDPFKPGRNGLIGLAQRIEINSPLALVIVMLGTNDFQAMHDNNAWLSGQGLAALIGTIRQAPIEPGMPVAADPDGRAAADGRAARPDRAEFSRWVRQGDRACGRLTARSLLLPTVIFSIPAPVTSASRVDGVHLDADQHLALGKALAEATQRILQIGP